MVPDPGKRLSDGVLLQATIRARFLGIRILTLDTTVVLAPADIAAAPSPRAGPPTIAPRRSLTVPPTPSRTAAPGLAAAVRSLNEGAELLARSKG